MINLGDHPYLALVAWLALCITVYEILKLCTVKGKIGTGGDED